MAHQKMKDDLSAERRGIELVQETVNEAYRQLQEKRKNLANVVASYNIKRSDLLQQEFKERKMAWCTRCNSAVPEAEASIMFIEGREEYRHGYGNEFYGFRAFSGLYRACASCRKKAADRHGYKGNWDEQCKDQASFSAFDVEKREDGFYARKFGSWIKLGDEHQVDEIPVRCVDKIADEWNLPPRIDLEHGSNSFKVREPATSDVPM